MGSGSEIAKEAADLILLDDNFASIVKGIEEGRLIFANLKKSIAYTLTSNIPEIIPFLATIALQFPLALTTIMILCIDLGTDILPAISFAYEKAESDIMKTPPRNRHTDKLVNGTLISWSYLQIGVIQSFAAFTTFFYVLDRGGFSTNLILSSYFRQNQMGSGWKNENDDVCYYNSLSNSGPAVSDLPKFAVDGSMYGGSYCATLNYRTDILKQAQTAFLACIVICQIGCGISCKTRMNSIISHGFRNMVFNFGICQELTLIFLLVYAPFMNEIFSTTDMEYPEWLIGIPFAVFIIFYDEIRKYCFRNFPNSSFKKWSYF
jgi:sodium/potassium-transporting ATPase subunit alpha